jgi:hypothetical protein
MADAQSIFLNALMGGSTGANMEDLGIFQKDIAANDIYGQLGNAVIGNKFDTGTWTPQQTGLTTALQMFAGTLLKDLGERNQVKQLNMMANILPSLQDNPLETVAPEGVDPLAFGKLRLNAITRKKQQDAVNQQLQGKAKMVILEDLLSKNPALAADTLGLDVPTKKEDSAAATTSIDSQGPNLGIPSISEVFDAKYKEALNRGQDSLRASTYASDSVDSLRKQSKALIGDKIVSGAELIKNLEDLVNTTEQGIATAGVTGIPGASAYESMASILPWADEAKMQAAGDIKLKEAGSAVSLTKKAPGAQSDFELKRLLSIAPGPDKSMAENESLLNGYKLALQSAKEKQAFLEYYSEKAAGNPARVETLWDLYREKNPLTILDKKTGEVKPNPAREPWQKFDFKSAYIDSLAGKTSGMNSMDSGLTLGETDPTGQYRAVYKNGKLIGKQRI